MGNPKETDFKPGIVGAEPHEVEEIGRLELGKRKISRGKSITGAALMVMGFLAGCRPSEAREPTPEVTETTGIPPTPTLEITPTPTEVLTAPSIPEPTKTPTPEPISTVTVEAIGFGMEDLTPEEQKLALDLETSYRTAVENQGLKEGIIYLTHGDQVGEIGGYFKDKKGFWYLVEREKKVLEQVPKLQGTSIIWDPNEVRFEYQPQGIPHNWLWRPQERMVYDPVNRINVAQWNPETASWIMNPEPTPEAVTYIEGIPFVGFSEQDLALIRDALTWGKEVVPEVLNFIVETNVAKVVYNPEVIGPWTIPPYPIQMPTGKFYREDVSIDTKKALFINTLDHESQHVRDLRRRGLNAPHGICSSEYPREQWLEDEVIACQRSAETLSRLIPHVPPEDQPYLQRLKEGYQLIVEEPERLTCPS